MEVLIPLGIIIAVIVGIALIKATVTIEYSDEVRLYVKVLFIKIGILPSKPKKPVDYSKFTAKRYKKMLEKDRARAIAKWKKAQAKKAEKAKKKAEKAEKLEQRLAEGHAPAKKRSIVENLSLIAAILKAFVKRFAKRLHIKVARLHINVATGDAANTAILYGYVSQGVAYILEILDRVTNLKYSTGSPEKFRPDVEVNADFVGEKTTVDVNISVSLRVWHLFNILFGAAFAAVPKLLKKK